MGKNPLINGITSTETLCIVEFEENVMTSTETNVKLVIKEYYNKNVEFNKYFNKIQKLKTKEDVTLTHNETKFECRANKF